MRTLIILTLSLILFSCNAREQAPPENLIQSEALQFTVDTLATGLENPWSMAFLPDGRILIAERPGRLRIFEDGALLPEPIGGLPEIWVHGQGGLLDVVLHPDFEENQLIYLGYAARGGEGGNTAIARGKLVGNTLTDVELLFHGQPFTSRPHHFGTRIVFDGNGYMFFTIGDRGEQENAQLISNHNGTVMRLHDDGRIPEDNPFVEDPEARPEIWSYGHRNIQGMALHPVTGELWAHEHGAQGGDEINRILKGENFGWPRVTHGINYDGSIITPDTTLPGMMDPVMHWTPSIAPCGLAFVTSEKYPGWENNMLAGALAGQHIHRVALEGNQVTHTERLLEGFARFRDIRQGPDGYIYVLTEGPGIFFRIQPWNQ
ncbi:MAG: PQQ-dependent sugar dehydrogenase [Bacteroides sp.]|jgi:glucose/arabinose dehydrogenase|nr:PQQ-dependent sugar dehydrogenase [Bacteroides sp.]